MRVLYVVHSMNNDGSTKALLHLIDGMRNFGVEIGVAVPHLNGYLYDKLVQLNIPIFYRRGYSSMMQYPSQKMTLIHKIRWFYEYSRILLGVHKDLYHIIKEFKPDVVHTNSSVIDYALLGCALTHTPHVWHVRELVMEGCDIDIFPSIGMLKWKMRRRFSHSIAVTRALYDYYNMSKKDVVVYDGVIDERMIVSPTKDFPFPYFISIGYISEIKGTLSLITQFCDYAQQNKNIHMLMVGGYSERDKLYQTCLTKIKESNIEDRVHFLGIRDDVYELIASAKALFICSKFEGFGFTPVEAMFCGTLVVGRNVGGVKEQFDNGLEHTGREIALRYMQDEELPELMDRALTEDFTEMKQRAREVVLNNYTISKNTQQILSFYKRIMKK